jgi:hypothetical protein
MRSGDDIVRDIAQLSGELVEGALLLGLAAAGRAVEVIGSSSRLARVPNASALVRAANSNVRTASPFIARGARDVSTTAVLVAGRIVLRVARPAMTALVDASAGRR